MPTLNKDLTITLSVKTLFAVLIAISAAIAFYYKVDMNIKEAMKLPESEVKRIEYDMKFKYQGDQILDLQRRVEKLEDEQ